MASKPIMQFKAILEDSPIWRRFQVAEDVRFSDLAYILMTLFEMHGSHLFAFHIDVASNMRKHPSDEFTVARIAKQYEDEGLGLIKVQMPIEEEWITMAEEDMGRPVIDATREYVKGQVTNVGDDLYFEYDFGECWEVKLTLEDIFEDESISDDILPRVVAGEGHGIIEDEHRLDCSDFNLERMNELLKKKLEAFQKSYEKYIVRKGN